MQKNRIAQLVGLLAVLLLVAWATGVFDTDPSTIDVPTVEVAVDEVTGISIEGPYQADVSLEGGIWQLAPPVSGRADTLAITRLLNTVGDLTLTSIVSTNPERYATYGVDDASGKKLTLRKGDETLASMVVSAQGPDFNSSYVRLEDGPAVYASSRVTLPATLDAMRDRTLARVEVPLVSSAEVTSPDGSYKLTYGVDGWTLAQAAGTAASADSSTVASWLNRFSPLRMDGFRDDLTPDSLDVTHRVRIEQMNGAVTELSFEAGDADLLGAAVGQPGIMRATSSRAGLLFPSASELLGQ